MFISVSKGLYEGAYHIIIKASDEQKRWDRKKDLTLHSNPVLSKRSVHNNNNKQIGLNPTL